MKITSDLTNLTTAILILTVQMFFEWTLFILFFNTFLQCHSLKVKAAVGADCFQNNTCSNALIRTKFMISIL
jgi:hypothetical protein